jgi:hypothetical protein
VAFVVDKVGEGVRFFRVLRFPLPIFILQTFPFLSSTIRGWDRSVNIATGYGPDARGSIPGRGKIFLFSTTSGPPMGPTQSPIQWAVGIIFPGVKRHRREANQSPPSSADVKNVGAV